MNYNAWQIFNSNVESHSCNNRIIVSQRKIYVYSKLIWLCPNVCIVVCNTLERHSVYRSMKCLLTVPIQSRQQNNTCCDSNTNDKPCTFTSIELFAYVEAYCLCCIWQRTNSATTSWINGIWVCPFKVVFILLSAGGKVDSIRSKQRNRT